VDFVQFLKIQIFHFLVGEDVFPGANCTFCLIVQLCVRILFARKTQSLKVVGEESQVQIAAAPLNIPTQHTWMDLCPLL